MFGFRKQADGVPPIRTRYLTPVLLSPAGAVAAAQGPVQGFLLELRDDQVTVVLGEELPPDSHYVLRIAGEEGMSEEPACTVLHSRRNDDDHIVAHLRFDSYRLAGRSAAA